MNASPLTKSASRTRAAAQSPPKLRLEGLDLLRLFAALSVVLYHYAFRGAAGDHMTWLSLPWLAPVAQYGYLGVDCFFVISGFVIAWSAEGQGWRRFAVARVARIYPAFVVCMTATFLLTLLIGFPRFEASIFRWAGNLLVFSPAAGVPFMDGAYWSIVYELVFYAWVALFLGAGVFPRRIRPLLIAWMAFSVMNEVAIHSRPLEKLLLTDHSGFFAAGIVLYHLRKGERDLLMWALLGLTSVVGVYQVLHGAVWVREHLGAHLSNPALVGVALGSVGIVAAAVAIPSIKLRPGVVAAIGGLTYPLYLLHQKAGYILFNRLEGRASAPVIAGLTTVLMIAAAWAVWRFAEPPGRRLIKRVFDWRAAVAVPQAA